MKEKCLLQILIGRSRKELTDLTNAFIQYITRNDLKAQISNLDYIPFNDMLPAIINRHPSPIAPENL